MAHPFSHDRSYETGSGVSTIEIKSGATVASDYFTSINRVGELIPGVSGKTVVYGGADTQFRSDCEVVPLSGLTEVPERSENSS